MASSVAGMRSAPAQLRRDVVRDVTLLFNRKIGKLGAGALRHVKAALERDDAQALARRLTAPADGIVDLGGAGTGPLVSLAVGTAALDEVTRDDETGDWAMSELLGAGDAAARLDVARATLDNWRRAGKAIAFRKGVRNYVYPMRQFERLRPVDGLDRAVARFATAEDAWEWLVAPNRHTGGAAPIDRLRAGRVDEVVSAAEGARDYA